MAKTSYRVKAEIESYSKQFKSIKHTQPFIVREPLKTNIAALRGEMEVKATTCCCCDKGVLINNINRPLTLKVYLVKTIIYQEKLRIFGLI